MDSERRPRQPFNSYHDTNLPYNSHPDPSSSLLPRPVQNGRRSSQADDTPFTNVLPPATIPSSNVATNRPIHPDLLKLRKLKEDIMNNRVPHYDPKLSFEALQSLRVDGNTTPEPQAAMTNGKATTESSQAIDAMDTSSPRPPIAARLSPEADISTVVPSRSKPDRPVLEALNTMPQETFSRSQPVLVVSQTTETEAGSSTTASLREQLAARRQPLKTNQPTPPPDMPEPPQPKSGSPPMAKDDSDPSSTSTDAMEVDNALAVVPPGDDNEPQPSGQRKTRFGAPRSATVQNAPAYASSLDRASQVASRLAQIPPPETVRPPRASFSSASPRPQSGLVPRSDSLASDRIGAPLPRSEAPPGELAGLLVSPHQGRQEHIPSPSSAKIGSSNNLIRRDHGPPDRREHPQSATSSIPPRHRDSSPRRYRDLDAPKNVEDYRASGTMYYDSPRSRSPAPSYLEPRNTGREIRDIDARPFVRRSEAELPYHDGQRRDSSTVPPPRRRASPPPPSPVPSTHRPGPMHYIPSSASVSAQPTSRTRGPPSPPPVQTRDVDRDFMRPQSPQRSALERTSSIPDDRQRSLSRSQSMSEIITPNNGRPTAPPHGVATSSPREMGPPGWITGGPPPVAMTSKGVPPDTRSASSRLPPPPARAARPEEVPPPLREVKREPDVPERPTRHGSSGGVGLPPRKDMPHLGSGGPRERPPSPAMESVRHSEPFRGDLSGRATLATRAAPAARDMMDYETDNISVRSASLSDRTDRRPLPDSHSRPLPGRELYDRHTPDDYPYRRDIPSPRPGEPPRPAPYTRIIPRDEWENHRPSMLPPRPPAVDRPPVSAPYDYQASAMVRSRSRSPTRGTPRRYDEYEDPRGMKRPRRDSMELDPYPRAAPPPPPPSWYDSEPYDPRGPGGRPPPRADYPQDRGPPRYDHRGPPPPPPLPTSARDPYGYDRRPSPPPTRYPNGGYPAEGSWPKDPAYRR